MSKIQNSKIENKYSNNRQAFSLIEMIIVILIVGIISTMTLASYRTGQRIEDLITQTQKVVIVLKRAQNMAMTGYFQSGSRTDYGYGVNIVSSNTYRLFIDNPGSLNYRYDSGDTIIQDFSLPTGIIFDSFDCENIVFKPPLGQVYCNAIPDFEGDRNIIIKQTVIGRQFWIRINSSGKISITSS